MIPHLRVHHDRRDRRRDRRRDHHRDHHHHHDHHDLHVHHREEYQALLLNG